METKLYAHIARKMEAIITCQKTNNTKWKELHTDSIESLVDGYMPSGSGIDSGTRFSWADSTSNKLVFTFGYHHINEYGYYDGWTEHKCIVTPSLAFGIDIKITGRDRNN